MGGSAAEDLPFPTLTSMVSKSGETMEASSETGSDNAGSVAAEMVEYINAAWTPFHAVHEAKQRLLTAGFQHLSERDDWKLVPGGRYFFTRNYSTIVAFAVGKKFKAGNGFWMIGAHTDSPCPKLRPVSSVSRAGFLQVGVAPYGGGLWHTWFDRDLSVAGRVVLRSTEKGAEQLRHRLVKIDRPILRIPTLAIHLEPDRTGGFKVNTQTQFFPLLATAIKDELGQATKKREAETPASDIKAHPILLQLLAAELGCAPEDITDFELSVCDTQAGTIGGAYSEFVFIGRLDNLCSTFCALKALTDSSPDAASLAEESGVRVVALFDHEEVGSESAHGAGSPTILDTIRRLTECFTDAHSGKGVVERALQNSFLVSADMAHCLHPNYTDRHDPDHAPGLHKGLVVKTNVNQRYASTAVTSALFRQIGRRHGLPTQDFVVKNDMACGSTIGPILSAETGIRTVDVGAPQLSMHSVREMCGVDDVGFAYRHFKAFYTDFAAAQADNNLKVDDV